ncbi:glycine-rich protein 3 short isoform-like [Raphanus sativus]|uniref:Glycine-rich protein 3 short isoform-like n=1 Tax=Raphanus sativus TaxID=3726 RepID=A0A9W3DLD8_RAPSA|nr:glycine-rich protein 3 short isoform-like [Raphanus sativus]
MAYKVLLLLGLLAVLLVASEVAEGSGRQPGTVKSASRGKVQPDQYGGGYGGGGGASGCSPGCCMAAPGYGGCSKCGPGYGGCSRCC